MSPKQPYKKPEFSFTDYEYFQVSKLDLFEYEILRDEIIESVRKKKVIEERVIERFFELLKRKEFGARKESQLTDQEIDEGIGQMMEYLDKQKRRKDYLFEAEEKEPVDLKVELEGVRQIITAYGDFEGMYVTVIKALRVIEAEHAEEWAGDKYFCMKEAFKEFMKYYWWYMSPKQRLLFDKPYKLIALSALMAHKIWRFGVSEKKELTMAEYNDIGTSALEKYNIDPKLLKENPPSDWM